MIPKLRKFHPLAIAAVTMVVVAVLGAALTIARYGVAVIEDGRELPGGAVQIEDGFASAFLLDAGPGAAVLIDAGNYPEARAIKAALAARGLAPADVVAILLTHGHGDHYGGVIAFPDAQVYAMAEDVALIEGREPRRSAVGRLIGARSTGTEVTIVRPGSGCPGIFRKTTRISSMRIARRRLPRSPRNPSTPWAGFPSRMSRGATS